MFELIMSSGGNDEDDIDDGELPWEDVEPCRNDQNTVLATTCPNCGNKVERFYFKSPDWTWDRLCGQAGWMEACFKCKKQLKFDMDIMS